MNLKLIDFALYALIRRFWQRLTVLIIFSFFVFLLTTVFSIATALKQELSGTLTALPELTVQRLSGGRQTMIPVDRVYDLAAIPGVASANPRVWGYDYFSSAAVNFTLIGLDPDLAVYKQSYANVLQLYSERIDTLTGPWFIAGNGVVRLLQDYYFDREFSFISSRGEVYSVPLAGTFNSDSDLETNDVILMPETFVRELFGLPEELCTDIVVRVPNPDEVETVKQKIQFRYPDTRIVSTAQIAASYDKLFNYRTGLFLAVLLGAFMAFFTLVYDKSSGLNLEEQREIALMKAVGWRISDILNLKLMENGFIALMAFLAGSVLGLIYGFWLDAPLLKNLFLGAGNLKPPLHLQPVFDLQLFGLTFMTVVPIYLLATIIPAWRTAILDADEVLR